MAEQNDVRRNTFAETMLRICDMSSPIATETDVETTATRDLNGNVERIRGIVSEFSCRAQQNAERARNVLALSVRMQARVARFRF